MKKHNYVVSVVETAKEHMQTVKLTGTTALMVAIPSITALAADVTPPAGSESYLTGDVWTAIQGGFSNLAVSCTQVVALATVTACGIVGMTAAARYAIKKIRGALSNAS